MSLQAQEMLQIAIDDLKRGKSIALSSLIVASSSFMGERTTFYFAVVREQPDSSVNRHYEET